MADFRLLFVPCKLAVKVQIHALLGVPHFIPTVPGIICTHYVTCCGWHEERRLWSQFLYGDVIVQDGLCVVGHYGQEVAVEDHLAVVKVEAAHLDGEGEEREREILDN